MPTDLDSSHGTLIVARPLRTHWFAAGCFAVLGLLFSFALTQSAWEGAEPRLLVISVLVSPLFLMAVGYTLWLTRTCVIADGFGLRWRLIGGWRHAGWDDVTDYYERGASHRRIVETPAGKLDLSADLDQRDALQETVVARALRARTRSWAEKGTRPEDDWPRTFDYDTPDNRIVPWFLGSCLVAAVAVAVAASLAIPKTLGLVPDVGWPWALCAGLLRATILIGIPLVGFLALRPVLAGTQRRKGQTIRADLEGLQYRGPEGEIAVRWDEVRAYHYGPATGWVQGSGPAVVVTSRGDFDFLHTLRGARQLRVIIQRYASGATTREWCGEDHERLGGETVCWSGGSAGEGQRVYHYRTRTNRALLGLAGSYWLAWVISAGVGPLRERLATEPAWVLGPGIVLTAGLLWLIWRYYTAAILVDERGITQRAWNGTRSLAWADIEELSSRGADDWCGTVAGKGRRVRFWTGIADLAELKAAISVRAPDAKRIGWKDLELD